jgi:hypothetical protein
LVRRASAQGYCVDVGVVVDTILFAMGSGSVMLPVA